MSRAALKPAPTTEAKRLAELHHYSILGTPAEDAFDRLVGLARSVSHTKGALLSFLGETRVYHKAQLGLQPHSYPRTQTLCSYAATNGKPLVIEDAQAAPEIAGLAFVKQNGVRFYLSVPLVTESGVALGSLSVFDTASRAHDDTLLDFLRQLAGTVMDLLEARRLGLEGRARQRRQRQPRGEAQLAELLELVPYYALTAKADGSLLYANRTLRSALELPSLPKKLSDLYPSRAHEALRAALSEALLTGQASLEAQLVSVSGTELLVKQRLFAHALGGGETLLLFIAYPLEAQKQQERLEGQRTEVLELIARGAPLPAVLLKLSRFLEENCSGVHAAVSLVREGRLQIEASPTLPSAFTRVLDGLELELAGGSGIAANTGKRVLSRDIRRDEVWRNLRYVALQQGFYACWSEPVLSEQGKVLGVFALYLREGRDPSDTELRLLREAAQLAAIAISRQQLYRKLEREANYDALTGLPNRRRLGEYMAWALGQATQRASVLGIMMLDLNDFKQVNDSLGHSAGDALLQEVAVRLQKCVPLGASVARSGGDEFVFVVPLEHQDDIASLAQDVTRALEAPFVVLGRNFTVGASIGVSLYPDDAPDAENLLRAADSAMYAAKAESKAGQKLSYRRYQPEMTEALEAQLRLEGELRRALLNDELRLYSQARFDLSRNQIIAFEALVRWQHPERGLLGPGDFLPVAEKASLLSQLDSWVLGQVARQLGYWQRTNRSERLSFNVSAASFQSPDFLTELEANLSAHEVSPAQLEVEITENLLMHDLQGAARQLHVLREKFPGMRVAIDDFGSGYSSLAYLRQLPVDTLKIDQAFIQDLDRGSARQQRTALAVIRTVVTLGRDLGFRIVAEGAETQAQLTMLMALGLHEVQGYVLGRPHPLSEVRLEPLESPNTLPESL